MNEITRTQFLQPVLDAMQEAEEIGGPEGTEYLHLMDAIVKEATTRRNTYLQSEWGVTT